MDQKEYYDTIWGRSEEISTLETLINQANCGISGMALVHGPAGVGKTFLVQKTIEKMMRPQDIFITSKYDKDATNEPYYAFVQLINTLVSYMLAVPKTELEENKKRIRKALGKNIKPLLCLIPELENSLGIVYDDVEDAIVAVNFKEKRKYIEYTFFQLLKELAYSESTVILFVDDMQWADELSLELLEYLFCNMNQGHLLFIGAFRECESLYQIAKKIDESNPCNCCFADIKLSNFNYQDIYCYFVHHPVGEQDIGLLTAAIYKKSLGNPFLINQIKATWQRQNKVGDVSNRITTEAIDRIAQEVGNEISLLPEETQNVLVCAAILGMNFSLDVLSQIIQSKKEKLEEQLCPALAMGVIIPVAQGQFEFSHNRFREVALQMNYNTPQLHLTVGRILLNNLTGSRQCNHLPNVLYHFIVAANMVEEDEKPILIGCFLKAGSNLFEISAYSEAAKYFEMALSFSKSNRGNSDLRYELNLKYASTLFLLEEYQKAEEHFQLAFSCATNKDQIIEILIQQVLLYFSIGKHEEAITLGVLALDTKGIKIPLNPSKGRILLKMFHTRYLLHRKKATQFKSGAASHEKVLYLIAQIGFSAIAVNYPLFCYLVFHYITLTARQTTTPYTSLGYTAAAVIAKTIYHDINRTRIWKTKSQSLIEQYPNNFFSWLSFYLNTILLNYWTEDWHKNISAFDCCYQVGMQQGIWTYAASVLQMKLNFLFCTGENLEDLQSAIQKALETTISLDVKEISLSLQVTSKMIETIQTLDLKPIEAPDLFQRIQARDNLMFTEMRMQGLFLSERYDEVKKETQKLGKKLEVAQGFCQYADLLFYQSLAILAISKETLQLTQKEKKILRKNRALFKEWYEICPSNFAQKYYLIEAEIARIEKNEACEELYNKAIILAAQNGFVQDEAISLEIAAKYCYSIGCLQKAETYIYNAYSKFYEWGATGKAKLLQNNYPCFCRKNEIPVVQDEIENLNEKIAEAVKIIFQETDTTKLLEHVMDVLLDLGKANKGCLLIEKNDELYIKLLRSNNHTSFIYNEVALCNYANVSHKIIYYVLNTCETVLLCPKVDKGIFVNDTYVNEHPNVSYLCIPLVIHGILLGALYMESEKVDIDQKEDRIEAIKGLSCQALLLEKMQRGIEEEGKESCKITNEGFKVDELTPRERDVLELVTNGKSNREIAERLDVSVNTVKSHILSVYSKLNVNRRTQAAMLAKELGII